MMPTGVAFLDARDQLFAAAERILLRDGPNRLTSRAVTAEAGCAKGVLHRHFTDFDTFLGELVLHRCARLDAQCVALLESAGSGTVAGNLATALVEIFDPIAVAIVGLVVSRDPVRAYLRRTTPSGIPVLTEASAMIASYLGAERDLGRFKADADVDTLAPTLIGAGHMVFADKEYASRDSAAVGKMVAAVIAGAT